MPDNLLNPEHKIGRGENNEGPADPRQARQAAEHCRQHLPPVALFYFCSSMSRDQRSPSTMGQAACKPGSVPAHPVRRRGMAIPLGRPLPDASRDLPGRLARKPAFPPQQERRPYLVLLPVGFTVPPPLPAPRCALAAPFHPRPQVLRPWRADCSLWHFPWGRPRRALPGTVFPWSPDFPPPGVPRERPSGHLTHGRCRSARTRFQALTAARADHRDARVSRDPAGRRLAPDGNGVGRPQ